MVDHTWILKAGCRGQPTEWFFPEVGERVSKKAEEICGSCPVTIECLNASLSPLEQGVWGGMGERQRRRYKERNQKT